MANVVVDMSVSVDGCVTAPGADLAHGLGVGGDVPHAWAVSATSAEDARIIEESLAHAGAVLMGRRTFDLVDGPNGWQGDLGYGAERDQSGPPPVVVVTRRVPEDVRLADRFTFVTDGSRVALDRAATHLTYRVAGR